MKHLNKRRLSLSNPASILCVLAIIFTSTPAYAKSISVSATTVSTDQSYTITHSSFSRLQEKAGNGSWKWVASNSGSITFKDKAPNTYYYRTYTSMMCWPVWRCPSPYSTTKSVKVYKGKAPALDTLDKQVQYKFETRVGDINYDGRKDIYIQRLSGNVNNGVISQAILVQNSNRSFGTFNASTNQLEIAKKWSKVSIDIALDDFNLDGYVDVFLKGVNKKITAAKDHIVFSHGAPFYSQAKAVKNIDANFKKTFSSVANWIVDEDYFKDNLITYYKWVLYPVTYYNPRTDRWEWYWMPGRKKYKKYDPNVITQDAVKIKNVLFDVLKTGEIKAGSKDAKDLSKTLEQSLGVAVFNNALTIQGLPLPYEDDKYLENARFLRLLSRLLNLASLIFTPGNEGPSAFYINHYTGTRGKAGIIREGFVRRSEDGYAYFTKDVYDSGTKAKSRLALRNKPTGFFIFNEDEMGGFFEPPRKVKPAFGENGGGMEIRHRGNAYYDSWRWIPIK